MENFNPIPVATCDDDIDDEISFTCEQNGGRIQMEMDRDGVRVTTDYSNQSYAREMNSGFSMRWLLVKLSHPHATA